MDSTPTGISLIRQLFQGQSENPFPADVVGLNSSERGRDLQQEAKQLQNRNKKPVAIVQVKSFAENLNYINIFCLKLKSNYFDFWLVKCNYLF